MIVKINCGGVMVCFGEPGAPNKPEPFYPYLQEVEAIAEANGEASASTGLTLSLKALPLVDLNVRRSVVILNDDLEEQFSGLIGRLTYTESIHITVEA